MSAYFLFDNLEVTDPDRLDDYKRRVGPVVEKYGGRYVAMGGPVTVVEGNWRPSYPVMIAFESAERARAWYDSDDYKDLKALRQSAVRCNAVLIDGL